MVTPPNSPPLLISGGRVVDPSVGFDEVADVLLADGRVSWVSPQGAAKPRPESCATLDARDLVVAPGFIDLHCHLREPGFEHKETIATGTLAAARGGFTSVCAMPNTQPAADSREVVEYVLKKAREEGVVRVFPIGCISRGEKGVELAEMGELVEAGVVAFSDDGMPVADAALMRHAMEYSIRYGLMLIEHCEEPSLSHGAPMNEGVLSARLGLRGAPAAAEEAMVARDIALAELTGARLHIAHVSTVGSIGLIRAAKARGVKVTAEATPHHLTLTEERVLGPGHGLSGIAFPGDGAGKAFPYDALAKVNPPLRTQRDVEALIAALRDGTIDIIATDHAPHSIEDKECEFDLAAFGISGLETALGALMTLVHGDKLDLVTLVERMSIGPGRLLQGAPGVPHLLGTLQAGAPADVVVVDPDREWVVRPEEFASKGKNTPLAGCLLKGKVMATVVGGSVVHGLGKEA